MRRLWRLIDCRCGEGSRGPVRIALSIIVMFLASGLPVGRPTAAQGPNYPPRPQGPWTGSDEVWTGESLEFDPFAELPTQPVSPSLLGDSVLDDSVLDDSVLAEFDPDAPIERFKRGFFQRFDLGGGSVFPFDNDLAESHAEAGVAVAVPLGNMQNILVINPTYRVDFWDSSLALDVPSELHQAGVNFLYRREWNERWSTLVLASPTIRSDFNVADPELRIFGVGLVQYQWIPEVLQVSFGAAHLGREDLPVVLPAAGLIWTPTPVWNFELMFPRPRVAYRLLKEGDRAETWAYAMGTIGGTTWNVERAGGAADELSAKDFRAMFGIERVLKGGGGVFVETGYIFSRHLEYEVGGEELDLGDAWMIQGGVKF